MARVILAAFVPISIMGVLSLGLVFRLPETLLLAFILTLVLIDGLRRGALAARAPLSQLYLLCIHFLLALASFGIILVLPHFVLLQVILLTNALLGILLNVAAYPQSHYDMKAVGRLTLLMAFQWNATVLFALHTFLILSQWFTVFSLALLATFTAYLLGRLLTSRVRLLLALFMGLIASEGALVALALPTTPFMNAALLAVILYLTEGLFDLKERGLLNPRSIVPYFLHSGALILTVLLTIPWAQSNLS
ncbi:MAG: hypothetical protein HY459_01185 [Parcubacteria group bacterium]|nr:hypothetical protein [Parcubacteria group bacterium]